MERPLAAVANAKDPVRSVVLAPEKNRRRRTPPDVRTATLPPWPVLLERGGPLTDPFATDCVSRVGTDYSSRAAASQMGGVLVGRAGGTK